MNSKKRINFNTAIILLCILLAATFLTFSAKIHAQTIADLNSINLDTIQDAALGPPADTSIKALDGVFGHDFATSPFKAFGPATTLLGSLFFVLNACLFTIGVFLSGWHMVVAVVNSANDGEVMGRGKGGALAWSPIKIGVGIFGMVPAFSGFSLAQAVMMFATILSIGIANLMTEKATSYILAGQNIIPNSSFMDTDETLTGEMQSLTRGLFLSNICVLLNNKEIDFTGKGLLDNQKIQFKHFQSKTQEGYDFGHCGKITLERRESGDERNGDTFSSMFASRIAAVNYDGIAQAAQDSAARQLIAVQRATSQEAQRWVQLSTTPGSQFAPINEILRTKETLDQITKQARIDLNTQLMDTTKGKISAIDPILKENIDRAGWSSIGAYQNLIFEVGAAVNDAQHAWKFSYQMGPKIERIKDMTADEAAQGGTLIGGLHKYLIATDLTKPTSKNLEAAWCPGALETELGNCSLGQNVIKFLATKLLADTGGAGVVNPVYFAAEFGDYMMNAGMAGIAGANADVIGDMIPAKNPATLAAKIAIAKTSDLMSTPIVQTISWTLFGFGSFLGVYVPLVPFIIWAGAFMNWFLRIFSAVAMASIWSFNHINGNPDNFADGTTARGYKHLTSILLTPGLMVIGFFAGGAALAYIGTWMFQTIFAAISSAQGSSSTGPVVITILLIVISVLMVGIITTTFDYMLNRMPNQVTGWLGDRAEDFHNHMFGAAAVGAGVRGINGGGGQQKSGNSDALASAGKFASKAITKA
ncbi:DotA/TraY family protein [Allopusillimonas ginsengisoli]|uniref:DotA/TraY family protein n=1 Tax=Allopusillimonas ginsengisoli TaxID=453575 RepID=UPI001430E9E4|nr:DotA/TraY family protein [Allopusillimonas ginsengisoli]